MNLVRSKPFREPGEFQNSFDRFFDTPFLRRAAWSEESSESKWNPVVDIYENGDNVVITAELPGLQKKDVSIDFKNGVLTLTGERTVEDEVKEENFYRRERVSGKFYRAFKLHDDTDPEKIEADLKDGVLKIDVPKPETKKPKKITVH